MKRNGDMSHLEPTVVRDSSPATHHSLLTARRCLIPIAVALAMTGCGTTAKRDIGTTARQPAIPGTAAPAPGRGGYYLDDGPGDNPPPDLDSIADAVPRWEPLQRSASRPYIVMGRTYTPMTALGYYKARGVASWYGRRYHGKQTSSGELYDMYGMTAAHPTLPIPSYVRVTNLGNSKSVVVRVNDRGPFLNGRIIDLSYTAAYKLGLLNGGSALVEVESILPGAAASAVVAARPAVTQPVAAAPVASGDSLVNEADGMPGVGQLPDTGADGPVQAASSGLFLQLGAFASRENAESYLARIKLQVDWLADRLQVLMRDGYYRVHAGPYASQAEAREIALRVSAVLGTKPVLVNR